MIRDGNPLMRRTVSVKDDVTASLMDDSVVEPCHKQSREIPPAQISRKLHATVRTSSRTRCSRILAGGASSKK